MAIGSYRTSYFNTTESTAVAGGECWVSGFVCNSTTSGTMVMYDGVSNTGTVVYSFTPTAGTPINLQNTHFLTGCWVDVGGTAIDLTFQLLAQ